MTMAAADETRTDAGAVQAAVTYGRVDGARDASGRGGRGVDTNIVIATVSLFAFLALWQAAAIFGWIDTLFTSSPLEVLQTGVRLAREGELWRHLGSSAKLFLTGFALSVVVGIPGGILLGWYPRLSAVFDPFVSILYVTPRIALIPLLFIWFGIGFQAQTVIVFLSAIFPLLINTIAGVKAIDPDLLRVARSFQARDRDIFTTLALPTALPFIVSGLRLSMGMALIGVVVAEFFTGNVGLGALITTAGISLQTDVAFVGVVVIAGLALLMTAALGRFEARLSRWRVQEEVSGGRRPSRVKGGRAAAE